MARTLYWNPTGNANWADVNVWSLTDGGTRDQSTPDATDDCNFTSTNNSNCSVSGTVNCKSCKFTDGALTTGYSGEFSGSATVQIYGNLTFSSNISLTHTGRFQHTNSSGTAIVTTNGKSITSNLFINCSGTGVVQLGDNFTSSCSLASTAFKLNAGSFDANGKTVTFTISAVGPVGIFTGTNSFYNLIKTGAAVVGDTLSLTGDITVSNTLTINGNSAINRLIVKSNTLGTARTITAATVTVTNADFQDITATGDAGDWDLSAIAGGSGDCGGNTGITFTTADDWYWHADTGNVNNYAKWYTATNGGGSQMASTLVPLPQDTLHFDASSFDSASQTITQNMPRIGSIDFTGATNTPAFTKTINFNTFGSVTMIGAMTISGNGQLVFSGRAANSFDSGGLTFGSVAIQCPSGSVTLKNNLTGATTSTLEVQNGTFSAVDGLNNYNVTFGYYTFLGLQTRAITMGSGIWEATGGGTYALNAISITNLTFNAGTSTFKLSGLLTTDRGFVGGGLTFNNFWIAQSGSYVLTMFSSGVYNDFKIDAGRTVKFTNSTNTAVNTFTALGTAGSHIVISNTSSTIHATLTKAETVSLIDSYSESNYSFYRFELYSGHNVASGQSFTNTSDKTLDSCKFYIKKTGSPTGNITATIYAHSGTYGTSSSPTGSALATSDVADSSTLSSSLSLVDFTFSGANRIALSASTYYCIVLNYSGGDASNKIEIGADHTTPTALGNSFYSTTLPNWTLDITAGYDLCFYVYGGSHDLISGCDYIDASYLTGSPADTWYIGENSTVTNCTDIYGPTSTTNTTNFFNFI